MNDMHINETELARRFRDEAADTSLSPEERMRMRSVVSAYVAMKPVRRRMGARATRRTRWYAFVFSPRMAVGVLAVGLVTSSAGVSYAAESALPGDVLYTVKRHVNEPVIEAVAVSPEAKIETATRFALRRLDEATELSRQGRLAEATREELTRDFEKHAEVAAAAAEPVVAVAPALADATTTPVVETLDHKLQEAEHELERLAASTTDLAPVVASVKQQRERIASARREKKEIVSVAVAVATGTHSGISGTDDEPRIATAAKRRPDTRRRRDVREEVGRPAIASIVATTSATTTVPVATSTMATSTEDNASRHGFFDTTIWAGEHAGSYVSDSVRSYFKRWSENDGRKGEDNDKGEDRDGSTTTKTKGDTDDETKGGM